MGKLGQVRSTLLKGSHQSKVRKAKKTEVVGKKAVAQKKNVIFRWSDGMSSRLPFSTGLRVLCVGEGDCSFAWSLHNHGISVMSTVYDSEAEFTSKYESSFVDLLRKEGVATMFQVDATKPLSAGVPGVGNYDMIVWNFPHTGQGITDRDYNLLSQQKLLSSFFSAQSSLNSSAKSSSVFSLFNISMSDDKYAESVSMVHNNEITPKTLFIIITLWCGEPYDSWNVKKIAAEHGWQCLLSFPFQPSLYPEYHHVLTKGSRHDIPKIKDARSYVFVKKSINKL